MRMRGKESKIVRNGRRTNIFHSLPHTSSGYYIHIQQESLSIVFSHSWFGKDVRKLECPHLSLSSPLFCHSLYFLSRPLSFPWFSFSPFSAKAQVALDVLPSLLPTFIHSVSEDGRIAERRTYGGKEDPLEVCAARKVLSFFVAFSFLIPANWPEYFTLFLGLSFSLLSLALILPLSGTVFL